ncbi:MAG: calcium/sodium antiporter [Spirochaetales bacterium]|nr:calcium/sodium antiporter [Spirochaetales bacterium]
MTALLSNIPINFLILLVSFFILAKSADFLVDGAVGIAEIFKIPKIIIGIVLVSFGTTSPEFTVTMIAALQGSAGIGLGNALGSVIFNGAVALAVAILLSPAPIPVEKRILNTTGLFLIGVFIVSFVMSLDGVLQRWEGILLLAMMVAYLVFLVFSESNERKKHKNDELPIEVEGHEKPGSLPLQFIRFAGGLAGVVIASRLLVFSAQNIAVYFGVPEIVIGLTIIAIGTSLPELATCIVAARKGHGDLAFGDIIGANVLNILWIIGAASAVAGITVSKDILYFAFPAVFISVLLVLGLARMGYRLNRWNGWVLIGCYVVYFSVMMYMYFL